MPNQRSLAQDAFIPATTPRPCLSGIFILQLLGFEPPCLWVILVTTIRVVIRLAIVNTFQKVYRIFIPVTGFFDPQAYWLPGSGLIGDFITVVACLLSIFVSTHTLQQ